MKLKLIVALSVVVMVFVVLGCRKVSNESASTSGQKVAYYTCPMHPSVKSDKPGACGICGMTLVPVYTNAPSAKP